MNPTGSKPNELTELDRLWKESPRSLAFRTLYDASKWGRNIRVAVIDRIRAGDPSAIEDGIHYLESDLWYYRSGYNKAAIAHALKRAILTDRQKARLQEVVLNSLARPIGREAFREYARLAVRLCDAAFLRLLEAQAAQPRGWPQLRAQRVLALCKKHAIPSAGS